MTMRIPSSSAAAAAVVLLSLMLLAVAAMATDATTVTTTLIVKDIMTMKVPQQHSRRRLHASTRTNNNNNNSIQTTTASLPTLQHQEQQNGRDLQEEQPYVIFFPEDPNKNPQQQQQSQQQQQQQQQGSSNANNNNNIGPTGGLFYPQNPYLVAPQQQQQQQQQQQSQQGSSGGGTSSSAGNGSVVATTTITSTSTTTTSTVNTNNNAVSAGGGSSSTTPVSKPNRFDNMDNINNGSNRNNNNNNDATAAEENSSNNNNSPSPGIGNVSPGAPTRTTNTATATNVFDNNDEDGSIPSWNTRDPDGGKSQTSSTPAPIATTSQRGGKDKKDDEDEPLIRTSRPPTGIPLTTTPTGPIPTTKPPTSSPTESPSLSPTAKPTISPSATPTATPVATPTVAPTSGPTSAPVTMLPTVDVSGFETKFFVDDKTNANGVLSECRRPVPEEDEIEDEVIQFAYNLVLKEGTDKTSIVDSIAARLHRAMIDEYLVCDYGTNATTAADVDFYAHSFNSLPADLVSDKETCDAADGTECAVIDAAYTVELFYVNIKDDDGDKEASNDRQRQLRRQFRRFLQEKGSSVNKSFAASLASAFESGDLTEGLPGVVGTTFVGITTNDDNEDSETKKEVEIKSKEKSRTGMIAGTVIGSLCLVALVGAAIAHFVVSKRNNKQQQHQPHNRAVNHVTSNRTYRSTVTPSNNVEVHSESFGRRNSNSMSNSGSGSGHYNSPTSNRGVKIREVKPETALPSLNCNSNRPPPESSRSLAQTEEILDNLKDAEDVAQAMLVADILPGDIQVDRRRNSQMNIDASGRSSFRGYGAPDTIDL